MEGGGAHGFSRRQVEILSLLRRSGRVSVDELSNQFDVSPQTIRRDLNEMAEARAITRVHGGAMVASGVANLAYDARKLVAHAHKRLIGEATPTPAERACHAGDSAPHIISWWRGNPPARTAFAALGCRVATLAMTN